MVFFIENIIHKGKVTNMNKTEILERKIIDEKVIVSKVKYNNTIVCIKSIFSGEKRIDDLLFNLAEERIHQEKNA